MSTNEDRAFKEGVEAFKNGESVEHINPHPFADVVYQILCPEAFERDEAARKQGFEQARQSQLVADAITANQTQNTNS